MKYLSIKKILGLGMILTVGALLLSPSFFNKNIVKGQSSCHTEIHIGEVVDETEKYGDELYTEYEDLYDNAVLAKDAGLSAAQDAMILVHNVATTTNSEVEEAYKLLDLTDTNLDNCKDCAGACLPGRCNCKQILEFDILEADAMARLGCQACDDTAVWPNYCAFDCAVGHLNCLPVFPWTCTWICTEPYYKCPKCENPCNCDTYTFDAVKESCARPDGTNSSCPMADIIIATTTLTGYYDSAVINHDDIDDAYSDIENIYNPKIAAANMKIIALTVLPTAHIPTFAEIWAKLDTAREELRNCVTPFGCTEQILMGNENCIIGGEIFDLEFLYTCRLLDYALQESNPRCDAEAADINKANNFFCCDSL